MLLSNLIQRLILPLRVLTIIVIVGTCCVGEDWPMWRYDAGRTAASSEQLPEKLHLRWTRKYAARRQAWDDPLNQDLMTYDRLLEPIIAENRLFVGFNDSDRVVAFDLSTGEQLWQYWADGPVRLPLAAAGEHIFFASDDGCLYCVSAHDGTLKWRFRGGPGNRMAIGNQRVISAWPSRGGPVVRDGVVYFSSSIWPFMGVFIYALDLNSGEVLWKNDETGSQFIKQPHSAPSFAGVAPQGALVATTDALIVPGGRSVPAVFDRKTGAFRYFEINAGGKGTGGSFVAANDDSFFVHTRNKGTREFFLSNGIKTAFLPNEPVLAADGYYSAEIKDGRPLLKAYDTGKTQLWEVSADGRGDLILAGNTLYAAGFQAPVEVSGEAKNAATASPAPPAEGLNRDAAGTGLLTAVRLPEGDQPPQVQWSIAVDGQPERLIAGNGTLIAVTLDGRIMAFSGEPQAQPAVITEPVVSLSAVADSQNRTRELFSSGDAQGYAFWLGAVDESLVNAVAAESPFVELAVFESDVDRVSRLRKQWTDAGIYGRVTAHAGVPDSFRAPSYVANMIFTGQEMASELTANPGQVNTIYESVRPYGGTLLMLAESAQKSALLEAVKGCELEQAEVTAVAGGVCVRRQGALPGAADWTHQHGNIANTIKSDDSRVRLPLGILWFGGSSNLDVLPRHGHGPPEQVVGGRLIIQGMNSLSARDVYTGRVLWKRDFSDLGTFDVYFDETYRDTPLDPAYNQVHIPGANARGTNYVVTEDRIYIVEGRNCHVLDAGNGNTILEIPLPQSNPNEVSEWGFIGVCGDILIGGVGFAKYRTRKELAAEDIDGEAVGKKAVFGSRSLDRAASMALVGFNRHDGKLQWRVDARHSFWHNGIVAGNGLVYALDRDPGQVEEALKRRGRPAPTTYRILAFNVQDGTTRWETADGIFGTWLGYSEKHDLLLQAGAAASDRLLTEAGQGMAVYRGADGSEVWKKDALVYSGPCILHNDLIITNANSYKESAGAFYLKDGVQKMVRNPLTGKMQPWKITRAYGCNTILASENLLTFRSGAAGFYDLLTESGTGNLGGFKSGCTSNLVVANGVLNAPDYTRTCSCAYQNQTSLALVHMPDMDVWTIDNAALADSGTEAFRHFGINLGAPGDRRDQHGTLWLEYPVVGGDSPDLGIQIEGTTSVFQDHSTEMRNSVLPWVTSSGIEGLTALSIRMSSVSAVASVTGFGSPAAAPSAAAIAPASSEKAASEAGSTTLNAPAEQPQLAEHTAEKDAAEQKYSIRLFFSTPGQLVKSRRVFDVYVEDKLVLENVTLGGDTGGSSTEVPREVVRSLNDQIVGERLHLRFVAKEGSPVLSGIEVNRKD